jgi:hypothetical protein
MAGVKLCQAGSEGRVHLRITAGKQKGSNCRIPDAVAAQSLALGQGPLWFEAGP